MKFHIILLFLQWSFTLSVYFLCEISHNPTKNSMKLVDFIEFFSIDPRLWFWQHYRSFRGVSSNLYYINAKDKSPLTQSLPFTSALAFTKISFALRATISVVTSTVSPGTTGVLNLTLSMPV